MEQNDVRVSDYWNRFLNSLPKESSYRKRPYHAEKWGDYRELAEELGGLIVAGEKTATCSSVLEWEAEGRPIPEKGLFTIVLDWTGTPLCIIETTEVEIKPYDQVDAQFAYAEGEGDRSLKYWREAHWRHFSRVLAAIGKKPTQDMLLVCERILVIYQE
jgi:uncharacterized protein YhfF